MVTELISQLGFPIVVALWMLVRLEKRMDKQIELLTVLITSQKVLVDHILDNDGGNRS